jgi:hypothetical protein
MMDVSFRPRVEMAGAEMLTGVNASGLRKPQRA